MAAKFCAQCGAGLGPVDKFCALCGTKVVSACPTCGQAWDGIAVSSAVDSITSPPTLQIPDTNKIKKPAIEKVESVVQGVAPDTLSGLVYGSAFDSAKDCANCGMAGKRKACDSCGSGSSK